ncbi:hypothetical protein FNF31_05161 [Cafeteria roenbergensis]|uniref:Uncharacterized protein n=1 Tax=Cafeteria roenbergensis TaxID=33653 RepID=A0A5A8D1B6_CAFRO|nr:hypothetical protein FNF31_05161 [Cafeteria roenbergensis]
MQALSPSTNAANKFGSKVAATEEPPRGKALFAVAAAGLATSMAGRAGPTLGDLLAEEDEEDDHAEGVSQAASPAAAASDAARPGQAASTPPSSSASASAPGASAAAGAAELSDADGVHDDGDEEEEDEELDVSPARSDATGGSSRSSRRRSVPRRLRTGTARQTASPSAILQLSAMLNDETGGAELDMAELDGDEDEDGAQAGASEPSIASPASPPARPHPVAPPSRSAALAAGTAAGLAASSSAAASGRPRHAEPVNQLSASAVMPSRRGAATPGRSCLSAKKPRLPRGARVAFGSPQTAEFRRTSPASHWTPLPKGAHSRASMGPEPTALVMDGAEDGGAQTSPANAPPAIGPTASSSSSSSGGGGGDSGDVADAEGGDVSPHTAKNDSILSSWEDSDGTPTRRAHKASSRRQSTAGLSPAGPLLEDGEGGAAHGDDAEDEDEDVDMDAPGVAADDSDEEDGTDAGTAEGAVEEPLPRRSPRLASKAVSRTSVGSTSGQAASDLALPAAGPLGARARGARRASFMPTSRSSHSSRSMQPRRASLATATLPSTGLWDEDEDEDDEEEVDGEEDSAAGTSPADGSAAAVAEAIREEDEEEEDEGEDEGEEAAAGAEEGTASSAAVQADASAATPSTPLRRSARRASVGKRASASKPVGTPEPKPATATPAGDQADADSDADMDGDDTPARNTRSASKRAAARRRSRRSSAGSAKAAGAGAAAGAADEDATVGLTALDGLLGQSATVSVHMDDDDTVGAYAADVATTTAALAGAVNAAATADVSMDRGDADVSADVDQDEPAVTRSGRRSRRRSSVSRRASGVSEAHERDPTLRVSQLATSSAGQSAAEDRTEALETSLGALLQQEGSPQRRPSARRVSSRRPRASTGRRSVRSSVGSARRSGSRHLVFRSVPGAGAGAGAGAGGEATETLGTLTGLLKDAVAKTQGADGEAAAAGAAADEVTMPLGTLGSLVDEAMGGGEDSDVASSSPFTDDEEDEEDHDEAVAGGAGATHAEAEAEDATETLGTLEGLLLAAAKQEVSGGADSDASDAEDEDEAEADDHEGDEEEERLLAAEALMLRESGVAVDDAERRRSHSRPRVDSEEFSRDEDAVAGEDDAEDDGAASDSMDEALGRPSSQGAAKRSRGPTDSDAGVASRRRSAGSSAGPVAPVGVHVAAARCGVPLPPSSEGTFAAEAHHSAQAAKRRLAGQELCQIVNGASAGSEAEVGPWEAAARSECGRQEAAALRWAGRQLAAGRTELGAALERALVRADTQEPLADGAMANPLAVAAARGKAGWVPLKALAELAAERTSLYVAEWRRDVRRHKMEALAKEEEAASGRAAAVAAAAGSLRGALARVRAEIAETRRAREAGERRAAEEKRIRAAVQAAERARSERAAALVAAQRLQERCEDAEARIEAVPRRTADGQRRRPSRVPAT